MKVDERVHQQDDEMCIMRWREVFHKFENMERLLHEKKKNSTTLNQRKVLKTDLKLKNNSKFVFQ